MIHGTYTVPVCTGCIRIHTHNITINPLTAGAEYIVFFTQLLPNSVLPSKHVKAMM